MNISDLERHFTLFRSRQVDFGCARYVSMYQVAKVFSLFILIYRNVLCEMKIALKWESEGLDSSHKPC